MTSALNINIYLTRRRNMWTTDIDEAKLFWSERYAWDAQKTSDLDLKRIKLPHWDDLWVLQNRETGLYIKGTKLINMEA
jgi:hypothetical protein